MINVQNVMTATVLALAMIAATPALAKSRATHPGHAARAQAIESDVGEGFMTPARADAIRACSAEAGRFGQIAWGVTQGGHYRTCMMERGQQE